MYDEQVALLGRPANFSLHHEGQQQAPGRSTAPPGNGVRTFKSKGFPGS